MEAAFDPGAGDGASTGLFAFYAAIAQLFGFGDAEVYALAAVFTRVGAVAALAPGFGERAMPARVRLVATIAFTIVVWPAIAPIAAASAVSSEAASASIQLWRLLLAEATVGLALGVAIRMFVFALQFAGSIAGQATSVAQIFGGGVTPDPMPAIGSILTMAGVTLALAAGLHVKLAATIIGSYEVLPYGVFPVAGDFATWGVARAMSAFGLAFALAAPFVAAALLYNLSLGAINRAMPQLMVAFVGAPAITAAALILLFASGPTILAHWVGLLDMTLAAPFAMPERG